MIRALLSLLVAAIAVANVSAQTYPARPIRVVVAYSPGAGVDLMARALAQKVSTTIGQPMVVENRAGANGIVGADYVAKSAPDGYTLLVIDRGALTINPSLHKALSYDPLKDFAYIGVSTELRYVVGISPALAAKNLAEFAQLARAKPGAMNYASFGAGSIVQLNFERLKTRFGMDLTHIPYKGTHQAVTAVMAGDAHIMMASPEGVQGYVKDGRLRALAISSSTRSPLLPEVPTAIEAGADPDTIVPTYFTYAAPGGTPRPVLDRLNAELRAALASPEVSDRLAKGGLAPLVMTPDAFTESVKRDIDQFGKLIRTLGIPPQ